MAPKKKAPPKKSSSQCEEKADSIETELVDVPLAPNPSVQTDAHSEVNSEDSSDNEESSESTTTSDEEEDEQPIGDEEIALARKAIEEYKKARAEAKVGMGSKDERRQAFESQEILTTQRTATDFSQRMANDEGLVEQLLLSMSNSDTGATPGRSSDHLLNIKPFALRAVGAKASTTAELGLGSEHPIPLPFANGRRVAEAISRPGDGAVLVDTPPTMEPVTSLTTQVAWARRDDNNLVLSFLTNADRFACLMEAVRDVASEGSTQDRGRGKLLDQLLQATLVKAIQKEGSAILTAKPLFPALRKASAEANSGIDEVDPNTDSSIGSGGTTNLTQQQVTAHRFSFVGSKRSREEDTILMGLLRDEDDGDAVLASASATDTIASQLPQVQQPQLLTQPLLPRKATTITQKSGAATIADLPSTQRVQAGPSQIGTFLEKGDFIAKAQWAEYQYELLVEKKNKDAKERAAERRSKHKR